MLTVLRIVPALVLLLVWNPGLYAFESHVLDNGLEVFLEESHTVPLVTIRLTFRAGAIVETPETNGLCHLYEHMLFKGNALYPDQRSFKAALKRMGTGSWNGGTSTEYVTYYITIPSIMVDEGLRFWAYAVMTPLLDEEELALERDVVHNEIAGDQSDPAYPLRMAVLKALYPDHWYRRDVGGDLAVIDRATVEQLRSIKEAFYVPNNAVLFVSGDITPDAVLKSAEKHFGHWQRGSGAPVLEAHKPLSENALIVVATSPTRGIADVSFIFRGPDTAVDAASTYGADVWGTMVNDPRGTFKQAIHAAVPELHGGTRYISAGYYTQRDGGTTSFSFKVSVPEKGGLRRVVGRLQKAVSEQIAGMVCTDYFPERTLAAAKQEIENDAVLARETPAGYMANLSFWWASTSTDYYLRYLDAIRSVGLQDVVRYVRSYLHEKPCLTSVWINPEDASRHSLGSAAQTQNLQND